MRTGATLKLSIFANPVRCRGIYFVCVMDVLYPKSSQIGFDRLAHFQYQLRIKIEDGYLRHDWVDRVCFGHLLKNFFVESSRGEGCTYAVGNDQGIFAPGIAGK